MNEKIIQIKEMTCCECCCTFFITEKHNDILLKDKSIFYCPNGHQQNYVGKSDAEKLKDIQKEKIKYQRWLSEETEKSNKLNLTIRSMKGNAAKLKKKLETSQKKK